MIDITVKTLDGQNRSFSVPENITVREFKEKISNSINIPAETQRLIFQGKVLHDEKLLKDYDVHGKVVHVVLRPPPASGQPPNADNLTPPTVNARDPNSVVVGSFTLPPGIIEPGVVQNIAQDAIRSLGDLGRNARVSTRTSTDGSAVDVHIHLGPVQTGGTHSEAQMRLNTARQMIQLAREALNLLENPNGTSQESTGSPRSSSPAATREPSQSTGREPHVTTTTEAGNQSASPIPMETDERDTSPMASTQTPGEAPAASSNQSAPSASGSQSEGSSQVPPRGPVRPNISALGEILEQVTELNTRLQPHVELFREIVRDAEMNQDEQRRNQRVCNMVSEAMHGLSHAYHAISDLMVDLSQNRPRQLYVTLAIAHPHTAVIQQTIPVHAQIQVGGSPRSIRRQFAARATPSTASATTTSSSSSTANPVSTATSAVPVSQTSTASTGTSTGPAPATTEAGTQSNEARPQQAAGTQHNGGLSNEEMQRIQQQMSAGLQSVLGQGISQGDGTPDHPYVFVEMGPDTMTVNSISAEVVTSSDPDHPMEHRPTPPASTGTSTSSTSTPTTGQGQQGSLPRQQPGQNMLPPNFIQDLVQQIVRQTGPGQPNHMQINIGQGGPLQGMMPPGMMASGMMGAMPQMGIRFGPRLVRPGAPPSTAQSGSQQAQSESGTQTAGAGGIPANSGTQTTGTPTSASGTQTSTSSTPNSTQTPGMGPGPRAFILPGSSGLAQHVSPVDPYLPCSSRHFLTQNARGILNQSPVTNDTALADMVSNLMSGLMGGRTSATTSGTSTATSGGASSSATSTTGGSTGTTPSAATTGASFNLGPFPFRPGMPGAVPMPGFAFGGAPTGFPPGMFQPGGTTFNLPGGRGRVMASVIRQGAQPGQASQIPASGPVFTPRPQGPAPAPGPNTAAPTGGQSGDQQGQGANQGEPNFLQMLRTMLANSAPGAGNQSNNASSGSTSSTASTTTTTSSAAGQTGTQSSGGAAGRQAMTDEAFTQLVGGITGYMSQAAMGQAPQQTIADFLGGLGENYSMPQGEGFFNDILSCILSHIQITDLVQVFYGQPTPLNQVQGPLREFLSERVLEGSPPFPDTIRSSVEKLVERMQPEIVDTVNCVQPRPHIDMVETLNRFFLLNLNNVITYIMNARENDHNFGSDFYGCVRRMLAEFLILCSRCLGGMDAVQRLIDNRMQALTGGVNPFIQQWMSSMTRRQLDTFIPTITVNDNEVGYYIVYRPVGQTATAAATGGSESKSANSSTAKSQQPTAKAKSGTASSSTQPTGPKSETVKSPSGPPAGPASMQSSGSSVEPKGTSVSAGSASERGQFPERASSPKRANKSSAIADERQNGQPMDMGSPGASEVVAKSSPPREVKGAASADISRTAKSTDSQPSPSGAQAASDDWQSVVPAEWVPVITRDVEAQRTQAQQRPLSDLYLQGMPPKRRKLMTQDRPNGNLSNSVEVLPASIRRAVAAASVEPISNMDNLTSEITQDAELHDAFRSQINNTLTERLESDRDFKRERFPNTEEYYHKKSEGKK